MITLFQSLQIKYAITQLRISDIIDCRDGDIVVITETIITKLGQENSWRLYIGKVINATGLPSSMEMSSGGAF